MPVQAPSEKPVRILFVCLANLCRSPMAEAIARRWHGPHVEAASAGVAPAPARMFPEALRVIRERTGLDMSGHVPRFVLDCQPAGFDYVIAMDSSVYRRLSVMSQIPQERLYGWEIADPCGLGLDAYERAAGDIEANLDQFLLNREMERGAASR